ncbi:hypothetical protein [Novosphingobium sp. KACC 22771]|uniref:hypothetical protein n=1 Tax=Novosphingobium sp. KACC 22771 TaxID=3025670 RepID=UPI002365FE7E|nr:hypothetical protein [Novosphingobium sp. KACC 22771]WDF73490.1 hypothetical protein PQ467_05445 [Novosphingobium sp. KACC 22771]
MDQTSPSIRIARVGTFTSNEGVKVSFGAKELAAAASAYDPASDPAPLVVGHPKIDAPAYGWVSGLAMDGDVLVATPDKIEPSFAELVRKGSYPKVSAQFYTPDHPGNPKPGNWYLKHIGFLGAHAPGIKGLGTVQFAAGDDEGALTFDFPTDGDNDVTKITEASFAERSAALDARDAELKAREAEIAAREKEDAKRAADARHTEHVSFAEGLVSSAKLAPAAKGLVVGLLDHFEATAVVSFGEAGDMAPADAFRKLLDTAKPLIDFGEHGKKPEGDKSYVSFAAPEGYDVDPERGELYAKAKAIQNDNPKMAWMDCVRRAQEAG